ncbi:MAG: tetratricopeptide repeat protein [Solidesulfovibrio sp.]
MLQRKVDHQRLLADARSIRENISRARGYLRRDDILRCIEVATDALMLKSTKSTLGLGRCEVDLLFSELCDEFSRHPRVLGFLESVGITGVTLLQYKAGNETLLIKKLAALRLKMDEVVQKEKEREEKSRASQKQEWLQLGQENLRQNNLPKGKVYLRRVVETYGEEEDTAREVGKLFFDAGLLAEASEMFAVAMEKFPGDQQVWRLAIDTYDALGDFKKAEGLYLDALKQYGGHPLTYLNIAKFYMKWRKRHDAYDYAMRALSLDPNLAEAKAIRDKLDR